MKKSIQLLREDLFEPLRIVMGVVDRVHATPILSNVLLHIENGILSVTGTDTEIELMGFVRTMDPSLHLEKITLPGRKLLEICRNLPDEAKIKIVLEDTGHVTVASGRSRFSLATLPANNFPNLTNKEGHIAFTLLQSELKALLQRTCFAMAQQDVRYYLNGVLFEINTDHLYTVATDGHRLALSSVKLMHPESISPHRVILPRKAALELSRLLGPDEKELRVMISANHLHVTSDNFSFTSKLLAGQFPDYGRVIPRPGNRVIEIQKEVLKQSLHRAGILCNMHNHSVRLEVKENTLTLSANNPEQESAEEVLPVQYSSEPLDINFNLNYLLDVLNTVNAQTVKLVFVDSNSPVVIEEVHNTVQSEVHSKESQWNSVFVVMPVHI